jgi:hypothetical protein
MGGQLRPDYTIHEELQNIIKINVNSVHQLFKWKYLRNLNVHHTYYQSGKKPWEYPDESLITLCNPCHRKTHEEEEINFLDKNGNKVKLYPCKKCMGTGFIQQYWYYKEGICFQCNGNRFESNTTHRQF